MAISRWEDEPANNKTITGLPSFLPLSSSNDVMSFGQYDVANDS